MTVNAVVRCASCNHIVRGQDTGPGIPVEYTAKNVRVCYQ